MPNKPECYSPGRTKSYSEIAENDCDNCLERDTCLNFSRNVQETKPQLSSDEDTVPYWLLPFRRWTDSIRQETAATRKEVEKLRQRNASLRQQNEALRQITPDRIKQIVEASTIKPSTMATPSDTHKQTGRTTRVLTEAFKLAKEGKAVYVLAANSKHMYNMERMADQLFGSGVASALGVKFETPASLTTFDFRTMQLKDAHPNCRVLIDHWTIESEYAILLKELHRYDAPTPEIQP